MTMTSARERGKDRWIPWAIVGAFLVAFAANGGLVYFALASWPGLSTDHAFSEGLAYNKVLDEAAREAALGWTLAAEFAPEAKGSARGALVVTARDRDGQALEGLALAAELVRPVGPAEPIAAALVPQGGGLYRAALTLPSHGQWEVYLRAERGGQQLHAGQRIVTP